MSSHIGRLTGRTHWKRLAIVMVPTLIVSGALLVAVAGGLVPVSLALAPGATSLTGQTFQVAADTLDGKGFAQYPVVDHAANGNHPDAVAIVDSADLYNLCQSMVTEVPVFGKVTLRIAAGGGGRPAHADHLVVNTDELTGDVLFGNVTTGRDASTLSSNPGPAGVIAEQADTVRIDHLRQQARSVSAATFRLNGLHLTVKAGANPCF